MTDQELDRIPGKTDRQGEKEPCWVIKMANFQDGCFSLSLLTLAAFVSHQQAPADKLAQQIQNLIRTCHRTIKDQIDHSI